MAGEARNLTENNVRVKIDNVRKVFNTRNGEMVALNGVSLDIHNNEFICVVGPSGCGKSTLLNIIAGLTAPTSGKVYCDGKEVTGTGTERGVVFQQYALFPWLTVKKNVMFALEMRGIKGKEAEEEALKYLAMVDLVKFADHYPKELSGGMKQRVAIARAYAANPEVLLMDEAFSALDPLIREQMQDELLDLQEKMKRTIVFITHDLDEAIKLGDRIAIMKDGEVVQVGTPEEILTDPADDYVTRFTESVDRGRVVTASSIMLTQPIVVRIRKDGPEAIIRKMREKRLYALPVIGADEQFLGEIRLKDVLRLRKEGVRDISSIVMKEVSSVLESMTVEDMLPLLPKVQQALPVVDENNRLKGVVSTSAIIIEMTGKDQKEIEEIIQNAIDL